MAKKQENCLKSRVVGPMSYFSAIFSPIFWARASGGRNRFRNLFCGWQRLWLVGLNPNRSLQTPQQFCVIRAPGPCRWTGKFAGKEKHVNINKFAGLSRDWVGAKILFMCFFFGSFLRGEKTHKQPPPKKSRDNSVNILFMCYFSLCAFFFSLPEMASLLESTTP